MSTRSLLRQLTAERHDWLEQLVDERGFHSDLSSYGAWLAATLQFSVLAYDAMARSGVSAALGLIDLAPAELSDILERIDRDIEDVRVSSPPPPANLEISARDVTEGYGVAYVVEGAALGARIIAERVRRLGCTEASGARYLTAQSARGSRWRRFASALDGLDLGEDEQKRMAEAACRAFDAAARCYGVMP